MSSSDCSASLRIDLESRPGLVAAGFVARAAALSLLGSVLGCTGNIDTPAALCIEQSKVQCAFQYQCCTDAEDRNRFMGGGLSALTVLTLGISTTEAECVESATALCQRGLASLTHVGVERERIDYDIDRATSCLAKQRDALSACDVEELREPFDDCQEIFVGLGRDGDACISGSECEDGATCEFEFDSDGLPRRVDEDFALPEGECRDLAGEGDDCDDRDCDEGLFCNDQGNCEEFAREGEDCFFARCDFDSFCNEFNECERDVFDDDDEEDFNYCRG